MTTHLPGNPYWDELLTTVDLSDDQQQISATLAVAYEQRTANLIAVHRISHESGWMDGDLIEDQIRTRLGLENS